MQGIVEGSGHGFRLIDVTQGDNLAHVMGGTEVALLELEVIGLGLRRESQKAHE